ncbi:MAG TPA: AAA family ATPase [Kineosporiaceae bacterium]|nr:AAA family ATPase [Kineosporiaceae bacterium]
MSDPEGLPVVVITGAPATGKSTLGRRVARRLHAALIDQDVATQPLVAVIQRLVGIHDLDDERLARVTREARYEAIAALAVDNLRVGIPVVLVAPYTSERADEQAWADLADRFVSAGGTPLLVWLSLEPTRILRRLQARGALRDQAKVTTDRAYLAQLSRAAAQPSAPHLALPAEQASEVLVRRVLGALNGSPA